MVSFRLPEGQQFRRLGVITGGAAVVATALAVTVGDVRAQNTDCNVIGPAANAVCNNPELVELSHDLLDALRELIRVSDVETRPQVIGNHRAWSISLDRCLGGQGTYECLYQAYEQRIAEVNSALTNQVGSFDPSAPDRAPVEQETLPPPPGASASTIIGNDAAAPPDGAPAAGAGAGAPPPAPNDTVAAVPPETPAAPEAPDGAGEAAPEEPASIAAATGAEAASDGAGADTANADNAGEGEVGEFRSAATEPAAAPEIDQSGPAGILTSTIWKAEIASGIRPGTIFVFHRDGALVTADCVESYKLGSWQIADDGNLVMKSGGGVDQNAEIVSIQNNFVRLQIAGENRGSALVLRPAIAPFSCSRS